MNQSLADHIDQLDLALDQLAMRDRNFDRFALMLIDNVVELTLHQHAVDKSNESKSWRRPNNPPYDDDTIAGALGFHFDRKVKLARTTELVTGETAEALRYLHSFRNTAYHRGMRHDGILHAIAQLYFRTACATLTRYSPPWWPSRGTVSHRAMKYLGNLESADSEEATKRAWARLDLVAGAMGDTLVADLSRDMASTIDAVDKELTFLEENQPGPRRTRDQIVIDCQSWSFAFSDAGKAYVARQGTPAQSVGDRVEWLAANYPWRTRTDPVPGWRRRLESLRGEQRPYAALKKYCEFMHQTAELREEIQQSAAALDAHIDQIVHEAMERNP